MELENLISLTQFCEHHSIDESFIFALNEHDLIDVLTLNENSYLHLDSIEKTEKIIRLHLDLSINIEGIDVIIQLLDRIESLENELMISKNKLSFYGLD